MAQVRAVRRPYVSRRGRANDAHSQSVEVEQQAEHQAEQVQSPRPPHRLDADVITIDLPPLPDVSDEEREAPGTGQPMVAVETSVDGTETELTTGLTETEIEADRQAALARAQLQEQPNVDISYASWTVAQLGAELKQRELPSSGSKTELVARLEAADAGQGA